METRKTLKLTLKDGKIKTFKLPEDTEDERFNWSPYGGSNFQSYYKCVEKKRRFLFWKYWDYSYSILVTSIRTKNVLYIEYE